MCATSLLSYRSVDPDHPDQDQHAWWPDLDYRLDFPGTFVMPRHTPPFPRSPSANARSDSPNNCCPKLRIAPGPRIHRCPGSTWSSPIAACLGLCLRIFQQLGDCHRADIGGTGSSGVPSIVSGGPDQRAGVEARELMCWCTPGVNARRAARHLNTRLRSPMRTSRDSGHASALRSCSSAWARADSTARGSLPAHVGDPWQCWAQSSSASFTSSPAARGRSSSRLAARTKRRRRCP